MAVLFSSIAGLAGMLPPKYMSAFMLGISLNGVSILLLRVITLLSFNILDKVKYFYGALIYFSTVSIFLGICGFGIFIVLKQDLIILNLAAILEDNYVGDSEAYRNRVKFLSANDTM